MHVDAIATGDDRVSRVRVQGVGDTVELTLRSTVPVTSDLTPWLALLLPAAMARGIPMHLHGSVDAVALEHQIDAQRLLAGWFPDMVGRVEVRSDESAPVAPRAPGVGLLFSGGVDAFHSALLHRDRVTHLLFVHGFDIPLWRTALRADVSRRLAEVAEGLGVTLIEVETDVKPWMDGLVRWGEIYHGAATAGVALAHSGHVGEALIASSEADDDLTPWGSHPDLDPLWSTSSQTIVHDARDYHRIDKVRDIVDWDLAMRHLRVCWENPDEVYNCGDCEKCVRTMVNLHIVGGLERCATLPDRLDLRRLRRPATHTEERHQIMANLTALEECGHPDPKVVAALRSALRRGSILGPVEQLVVHPARRVERALRSSIGWRR